VSEQYYYEFDYLVTKGGIMRRMARIIPIAIKYRDHFFIRDAMCSIIKKEFHPDAESITIQSVRELDGREQMEYRRSANYREKT
jgi:hypothetical protein